MTINTLLKQTSTIDTLDAELLLAHVINKPREFFIAHGNEHIKISQKFQFFRLVKKRETGIPIAYITGNKEFYGLDFFVTKDTLIPRPDTETMVDLAIKKSGNMAVLIDVGTGTGCIPIAIIKSLDNKNIKTIAIDISESALRVAKKNAAQHNANIEFYKGNLLSPIIDSKIFDLQSSIIITANLPYLTQKEINESPSIQHEPHLALHADDHGLALYKKLLQEVSAIIQKNSYLKISVLMEISPWQSELLKNYCYSLFGQYKINSHQDLSNRERVISLDIN